MKRYTMLGTLAALALAGAGIAGCGKGTAAEQPAGSVRTAVLGPDDVARAARRDLIAGVPVSGTLEPAVEVRIASPIPEVVEQVFVKEGQAVQRGQVLARFRTSAVEPAALSAEAQRRKAEADFQRMQNLYKEGAVSEQDVESADVALRAAQANEAGARKRLDEATVRAPVSGAISKRAVDSGDRVKDGDLLFQLVDTRQRGGGGCAPGGAGPRLGGQPRRPAGGRPVRGRPHRVAGRQERGRGAAHGRACRGGRQGLRAHRRGGQDRPPRRHRGRRRRAGVPGGDQDRTSGRGNGDRGPGERARGW